MGGLGLAAPFRPLIKGTPATGCRTSASASKPVPPRRLPSELGLAALSNSQPHVWRMCTACIAQDLETFGVAYWHRTHQLPGVAVCLVHVQQLHEIRIPYWARQKCFLGAEALHVTFEKSPSHRKNDCTHVTLEVARFAELALSARNCEVVDPATIRRVILDALGARGLTNRGGAINPKEFAAQFITNYETLAGCNNFSAYLNTKALARLAKALSSSPMMIPPALSVLVATWLFGSWEGFRAHCEWRASIDTPLAYFPLDDKKRPPIENRKEHREACLAFMASIPGASRTDFWHAHPKACRWLAQFDCEWLESRLPITKIYAPRQLKFF